MRIVSAGMHFAWALRDEIRGAIHGLYRNMLSLFSIYTIT
jgi:hypothetical protein